VPATIAGPGPVLARATHGLPCPMPGPVACGGVPPGPAARTFLMASLARGGLANGAESVHFVAARSAAPVARALAPYAREPSS